MKHLGDITKINGAEIEIVDVITGGSPCQDLSIAGKRAGLAGARSGLFMEQVRIVKEMRERDRANGRTGDMVRPRFMVWENVPGADVAPVVRCKDCKHRSESGNCGHPRHHGILPSAYPYDFCSYGERRDYD